MVCSGYEIGIAATEASARGWPCEAALSANDGPAVLLPASSKLVRGTISIPTTGRTRFTSSGSITVVRFHCVRAVAVRLKQPSFTPRELLSVIRQHSYLPLHHLLCRHADLLDEKLCERRMSGTRTLIAMALVQPLLRNNEIDAAVGRASCIAILSIGLPRSPASIARRGCGMRPKAGFPR